MSKRDHRQNRLNISNSPSAKFIATDDSKQYSINQQKSGKSQPVKSSSSKRLDLHSTFHNFNSISHEIQLNRTSMRNDSSPQSNNTIIKENDYKFQQLLDKIVEKESDKVYEILTPRNLAQSIAADPNKFSSVADISSPTSTTKLKRNYAETPDSNSKQRIRFEFSELNKSRFNQTKSEIRLDSEDVSPNRKKTSRFSEIISLRKQKAFLEQQNNLLHQNLEEIDEFEITLSKKTRLEDFNEKRCDILKACIQKQKRYIDLLNSSIKLSKKFYKDLVNCLKFLSDMHKKYMSAPNQIQVNRNDLRNDNHVEIARKTISELLEENGNPDYVKNFIKNFNEAYTKVKTANEKSEEVNKLFNLTKDLMKHGGASFFTKMNPEVQKKIKYNYMFSQFIKDNKRFFPIYTVFNEFDLKDKNNFGEFINHLMKMMDKTDEVFKKIKLFSIMKHSHFAYNEDIPANLIERASDFDFYFNTSNQKKKIFLNHKQIFDVERNLAILLNQLISFHTSLLTSKDGISVKQVQELQENLRNNIESLLLLGITASSDQRKRDKLVVIHDEFLRTPDNMKPDQEVEKKILFEIYNEEIEKFKDFEKQKATIINIVDDTLSQLRENTQLKSNMKNLRYLVEDVSLKYEDQQLISSLKQTELTFCREYTRMITRDVEMMEKKVNDKMKFFQEFLKKIEINMESINKLVEKTFNTSINPIEAKEKAEFYITYKGHSRDILTSLKDVLSHNPDAASSDLLMLKDNFKKELVDLKRNYSLNCDRVNAIKSSLRKLN